MGITFKVGVNVGKDVPVEGPARRIRRCLCGGRNLEGPEIGVPGEEAKKVYLRHGLPRKE